MKEPYLLLIGCLVIALLAAPVLASGQDATGLQVGGINNHQTVTNYNNEQTAGGTQVGGHDNVMVNTNINGDINTANTQTTITNNQISLAVDTPSTKYELNIPDVQSVLQTLYLGQVVAVNLGKVNEGQTYYFDWTSSVPVLVYVVDDASVDSAVNSNLGAVTYDNTYQKWEHNGVYHYPVIYANDVYVNGERTTVNEGLSRYNNVSFTAPELGTYSFVINTKPSIARNTLNTPITDDTVDIQYTVIKDGYHPPEKFQRTVIGIHDECNITKTLM